MPLAFAPYEWVFYSGVAVACVTLLLIAVPTRSR